MMFQSCSLSLENAPHSAVIIQNKFSTYLMILIHLRIDLFIYDNIYCVCYRDLGNGLGRLGARWSCPQSVHSLGR